MPFRIAGHAVFLSAQWTLKFVVLGIPFELKVASSGRTTTHIVERIDGSAEGQSQVAITIRVRLQTSQDILLHQRSFALFVDFVIAQKRAGHLGLVDFTIASFSAHILGEAFFTKLMQTRP